MKKFKLTNTTVEHCGKILYQIQALKSFNDVKKFERGGYVQCEKNLSQIGKSWIYDNAKVYSKAEVLEDAEIREFAEVSGTMIIKGGSKIFGNCHLFGNWTLCGDSFIYGFVQMGNLNKEKKRQKMCIKV